MLGECEPGRGLIEWNNTEGPKGTNAIISENRVFRIGPVEGINRRLWSLQTFPFTH